jgi:hypothetical protein
MAIHAVDDGDRRVLEQIAGEAESVATLLELVITHAEQRALSWPWECAEAAPPKTRRLQLDV